MRFVLALAALPLAACDEPMGHEHYKLMRSSVIMPDSFHVATFDADEGNNYNQVNCNAFAEAAMSQPGVTVRYWCERQ